VPRRLPTRRKLRLPFISRFEARPLPMAIWLNEEVVAGPFCKHCGYPLTLHRTDSMWCPRAPNGVLGPSCDCHVIREIDGIKVIDNKGGPDG
jgi:hypothetical protein